MAQLDIDDSLAEHIQKLAARRGVSVTSLLRDALPPEDPTPGSIESVQQLRGVVSLAPDAILTVDTAQRILSFNPGAQRIFGYEPGDIVGEHLARLIPQTAVDRYEGYVYGFSAGAINEARMENRDNVQGRRADGSVFPARVSVSKYDGGFVVICQDITEQCETEAALRQERNLLSSIMNTSPSGITVLDCDGKIIFMNERSEEIYGSARKVEDNLTYDDPRWRHTDFDGKPWPDEKQPFVRVMQTKQAVWNVQHAVEDEAGHRVYLSINGMPHLDEAGEVERIVFTVEDVTVQRQWQNNLLKLLDREVELSHLKSRFLSMVSHEFRMPLAVILTSAGLLRLHYQRMPEEERLNRLLMIEDQVKRMKKMLDEVSELNQTHFSETNLKPTLLDVDSYIPLIIEEIELAFPKGPPVLCQQNGTHKTIKTDETHFHQILNNLLSNAVKYTPPEKAVWLLMTCYEDKTEIVVRDEGMGIPVADQQNLFKVFQRASNVGDIPGTGMGLVIVQHSIKMLGGSLTFNSQEGKGTTFRVVLPVELPSHAD